MTGTREEALRLYREHEARGDTRGYFEALYASAEGDPAAIPWADLAPNPLLVRWLAAEGALSGPCLVVGCGLGDDAAALAGAGARVTAFDVSPTAVAWAGQRWQGRGIAFVAADLLAPPEAWRGRFALVVECYTLQVLDEPARRRALQALAGVLSEGGRLLVVCRGREAGEPLGSPPWPLHRAELEAPLRAAGLCCLSHEDGPDAESPPVRRFVSLWRRGGG